MIRKIRMTVKDSGVYVGGYRVATLFDFGTHRPKCLVMVHDMVQGTTDIIVETFDGQSFSVPISIIKYGIHLEVESETVGRNEYTVKVDIGDKYTPYELEQISRPSQVFTNIPTNSMGNNSASVPANKIYYDSRGEPFTLSVCGQGTESAGDPKSGAGDPKSGAGDPKSGAGSGIRFDAGDKVK